MNKKMGFGVVLLLAAAFTAYAQQYNSEKDFKVKKEGNGITITKYSGKATVINIPPTIQNLPVTSIGRRAFYVGPFSKITSVTIPDSVTSIGPEAFSFCSTLTSITIGSGVTNIGNRAFGNCSGLTSITIPASVTSIDNYAFVSCHNLTSITISEGVTTIGGIAFAGCSSLTSITIPASVTSIGENAFYNCVSLTSVTFEGTINNLDNTAFGVYGDMGYVGNLVERYLTGGIGTYTRPKGSATWTNPNAAAGPQLGTIIQDSRLNGRWRASARVGEYPGNVVQFTFNDGQYEVLNEWGMDRMNRSLIDLWLKGTYTTDDKGVIAAKVTHVYDTNGKKWTSKDEAIANLKSQGRTDAQINDTIAWNFFDWSTRYSISGNVLTIDDVAIDDDVKERGTFTKQN